MSNGGLPKGWETTKLGDLGRYLNGYAFSERTWSPDGRPIIRIQNLTGSNNTFNFYDGELPDRYVVRRDDLLVSWAATLGVYVWHGPEALLNQHIFKVESFIDKSFHRFLIEQKLQEMMSETHGTGMVHITKGKFDAVPVLLPPLPEQHLIVEILEEKFSRLDAALTSIRTVREKAAQFRRSLLHAAFSGALTGHESEKGLPQGWTSPPLGRTCLHVSKILPTDLNRESIWYIDIGSINSDTFNIESPQYISAVGAPTRARQQVKYGDTVFSTVRPYLKKIGWVSEKLDAEIASTGFCVLRADPKLLDSKYLHFFAVSDSLLDQVLPLQRGVSYPAVRDNDIHSSFIPLPSLQEQHLIVEVLEEQFSRLDDAVKVTDQLEARIAAERRSLLHAAFTGALTSTWRETQYV